MGSNLVTVYLLPHPRGHCLSVKMVELLEMRAPHNRNQAPNARLCITAADSDEHLAF
jgi:hypothetical protein